MGGGISAVSSKKAFSGVSVSRGHEKYEEAHLFLIIEILAWCDTGRLTYYLNFMLQPQQKILQFIGTDEAIHLSLR